MVALRISSLTEKRSLLQALCKSQNSPASPAVFQPHPRTGIHYRSVMTKPLLHRVAPRAEKKQTQSSCMALFFFFFFKHRQYVLFFFFNLFLAVLGLRFCARAFSSCGRWGPLFIAVHRPLIIAASLVAEHRLQTRRLSNCGSRA